jgi:gluconate 2-dehydrogenase gamma chain
MTPEQQVKAGIEIANAACIARHGKPFDQITPMQANAFLHDLADDKLANESFSMAMWFNDLVYPLFAEACFADPIYGGNVDKVFWKMIGYPGLPATHTINMIRYRGVPFPGAADPQSIVDFS